MQRDRLRIPRQPPPKRTSMRSISAPVIRRPRAWIWGNTASCTSPPMVCSTMSILSFRGIILSMVDEQGRPQNGFLRLHDIYNLDLPVELVVLSACNSGLGKQVRGEGLVGIVRGFMYAGAERVVASLWKVDDEATGHLMKLFYREMLEKGLPPAAALRQAQIAMWRQSDWRQPFYWAAFVLQGEWM